MIGKVGLHENQDKPHAVIFKRAAGQGRLSWISSPLPRTTISLGSDRFQSLWGQTLFGVDSLWGRLSLGSDDSLWRLSLATLFATLFGVRPIRLSLGSDRFRIFSAQAISLGSDRFRIFSAQARPRARSSSARCLFCLWAQTDLEFSPLRPRARSSAMRSRLVFDSLWSRAANRADRLGTLSGRERPRIGTSSARVASVWCFAR